MATHAASPPATPHRSARRMPPGRVGDANAPRSSGLEQEISPGDTSGPSAAGGSFPVTPEDGNPGGAVINNHDVDLFVAAQASGGSSPSRPAAVRAGAARAANVWSADDAAHDSIYYSKQTAHQTDAVTKETYLEGVLVTKENAQALLPPAACVFVANLASTRTDEQLDSSVTQVFQKFGQVYVKIKRDIRGMPYAFAQYENVSESERAILEGRGVIIDGRQCRTERAKARRSLFLSRTTGGTITETEAKLLLREFGEVEKCWVASPTDKEMYRLPDGIWIMWSYFQSARDAQNAFKSHELYRLEEPTLPGELRHRVERAMDSPYARTSPGSVDESPQTRMARAAGHTSLYVSGLPFNVTQSQLYNNFNPYGNIRGIEIISKAASNGGGASVFAFVELASVDEVRLAISREHFIDGQHLRVEMKQSPPQSGNHMVSTGGNLMVSTGGSHMVSTGSPRSRNRTTSPEATHDMGNMSSAVSRAMSANVPPDIISYIFGIPLPPTYRQSTATAAPTMAAPTFPAAEGPFYGYSPFAAPSGMDRDPYAGLPVQYEYPTPDAYFYAGQAGAGQTGAGQGGGQSFY